MLALQLFHTVHKIFNENLSYPFATCPHKKPRNKVILKAI